MSRINEREIARKLAEREGFEPPAGLLERIKDEIPPVVSVGREAVQAGRRDAMPPRKLWLVAASLIGVIGAGLLTLRVREEVPAMAPAGEAVVLEKAVEPAKPAAKSRRDLLQEAPPPASVRQEEEKALRALGYMAESDAQATQDSVEGGVAGEVAGVVPGGVVGGVVSQKPAAEPAQPVEVPVEAQEAPSPERSRPAKPEAASAAPSLLRAGKLPDQASARVQELASLFAEGKAMKDEGAPSPFAPGERWRLLRFNKDVELNPEVVARHQRLGHGLYEVELWPGASPSAPLAKGKALRLVDLAPTWEKATPDLRLAAVAAELAEILEGAEGDLNDVYRRAQELAREFAGTPREAEVKELAALAGRAARLKAGQAPP